MAINCLTRHYTQARESFVKALQCMVDTKSIEESQTDQLSQSLDLSVIKETFKLDQLSLPTDGSVKLDIKILNLLLKKCFGFSNHDPVGELAEMEHLSELALQLCGEETKYKQHELWLERVQTYSLFLNKYDKAKMCLLKANELMSEKYGQDSAMYMTYLRYACYHNSMVDDMVELKENSEHVFQLRLAHSCGDQEEETPSIFMLEAFYN